MEGCSQELVRKILPAQLLTIEVMTAWPAFADTTLIQKESVDKSAICVKNGTSTLDNVHSVTGDISWSMGFVKLFLFICQATNQRPSL